MSLLEVILALAILAGSVAALGELIRVGIEHAGNAQLLTEAQLLCETKLAELTSGIEPVQAVSMVPLYGAVEDLDLEASTFLETSPWVYSVEIATIEQQTGLVAVRVTVSQDPAEFPRPVSFSLLRWMPDTGIEIPLEEESESTESSNTTNVETGSSTTGGSGTP